MVFGWFSAGLGRCRWFSAGLGRFRTVSHLIGSDAGVGEGETEALGQARSLRVRGRDMVRVAGCRVACEPRGGASDCRHVAARGGGKPSTAEGQD
jgi:hypothetical protein